MTNRVLWWQFSDLHWPTKPTRERIEFAKNFVKKLTTEIVDKHGRPDFIAFTGDIAASGQAAEYDSAYEHFFGPLSTSLSGNTPIFGVPGNHDMDWTEAGFLNSSIITSISSAAELDAFVGNESSLRAYLRPFINYSNFAQRAFAPETSNPFTWQRELDVGGTFIRLTGVNTAWSSRYSFLTNQTSDERHLLLAQTQIDESDDQPDGPSYRLLLMHHPFDWFNSETCARQETRINQQFDVVLSGHVHSARSLRLVIVPGSQSCMIPSPLLFGSDYEDSTEFARAFVAAKIVTDDSELSCRYYKYSETFGPKIVPYLDIYPPDQDHFSTSLKRPTSSPRRETSGGGNLLSRALSLVIAHNSENIHGAVESFHQILHALNASGDLVLPQVEPSVLSLMILIGDAVINCAASGYERLADPSHIAIVESCRKLIEEYSDFSSDVKSAVSQVISDVRLDDLTFVDLLDLSDPVTGLVMATIWGIAQAALFVAHPSLIPAPGHMASFDDQSSSNIIRVESDRHTGRLTLQVKTGTRDEFHRLEECRHTIQHYFSELEDLWRQAGLVPRPIRFDLGYPLWSRKMIESHNFQVDARPITNLLMGKALYGDQEDVWIRELIQNAIDAVTMRKRIDVSAEEPHIEFRLIDAHTITIADNGVGMDGEHIVYYLATLGRSGWRTIEKRPDNSESVDPQSFYGRFGIGFASVFSAANEVTVTTRYATSRSVDGVRVRFTSPDRPFFVETAARSPGTTIKIRLQEGMSAADMRESLTALFLYLPPFVTVSPEIELANALENVSLISRIALPPGSLTETKTRDCTLGAYRLRIKTDLVSFGIPPRTGKASTRAPALPFGKDLPESVLDIGVEGVRVFKQHGLLIDESGRSLAERKSYADRSDTSMYLRGLYVVIDFAREGAPVLPSRNALDVESGIREELKGLIEEEFIALLPTLVSRIAGKARGSRQLRSQLIRFFNNMIWTNYTHSSRHPSAKVQLAASRVFIRWCPLRVQQLDGPDDYKLVSEIDASIVSTIVLRSISNSDTFKIYARSSNLSTWIVADSILEIRLIQDSWTDHDLSVLLSTAQLWTEFDVLADESRTGELVKLLRGDYALVRSDIFSGKLFFHPPGSSMPRHVGASMRRVDAPYSARPRVMINVEHPLIVAIEHYLTNADANGSALVVSWFDSFSDGIIEDKHTRLAPMARWSKLRDRLATLVDEDISTITFDDLRIEI